MDAMERGNDNVCQSFTKFKDALVTIDQSMQIISCCLVATLIIDFANLDLKNSIGIGNMTIYYSRRR